MKHGCIYIITIQTISFGPPKVDLNTHDIRLGRIYFHSTLLIRWFILSGESWGTPGIRWPAICVLYWQDNCRFTPFSSIDLYPSCPLNRSLNGTNLPCYLFKAANILKVPYSFGLNLDCLALFLFLRLHLLDIISPTGSNELIRYCVYIWINLGWVHNIFYFEFNLSYSECNMYIVYSWVKYISYFELNISS